MPDDAGGVEPAAHRIALFALAVVSYTAVTVTFSIFERNGLGIGHFFYVPIALVAFATGPVLGGLAGVLATALFTASVAINPHLITALPIEQTSIRFVIFTGIGALIGGFARRNRELVRELSRLANRDSVTGLPNTRAFQNAIESRLAARAPFLLLVGDVDELRGINAAGRDKGDEALRRLADRLVSAKREGDEVSRVGGDEFAIVAALGSSDGKTLAMGLERQLTLAGESVTFGWATYPQDGENALALYRAADERLYARKLSRGFRRGPPQGDPLPASA